MKNHSLLNSCLFLLSLFFVTDLVADEMEPAVLFQQAQIAYKKPDCTATLYYLETYLKADTPSVTKKASIDAVIQWCQLYLADGIKTSKAIGFMATSKEQELTEAGKLMLLDKPVLRLQ